MPLAGWGSHHRQHTLDSPQSHLAITAGSTDTVVSDPADTWEGEGSLPTSPRAPLAQQPQQEEDGHTRAGHATGPTSDLCSSPPPSPAAQVPPTGKAAGAIGVSRTALAAALVNQMPELLLQMQALLQVGHFQGARWLGVCG